MNGVLKKGGEIRTDTTILRSALRGLETMAGHQAAAEIERLENALSEATASEVYQRWSTACADLSKTHAELEQQRAYAEHSAAALRAWKAWWESSNPDDTPIEALRLTGVALAKNLNGGTGEVRTFPAAGTDEGPSNGHPSSAPTNSESCLGHSNLVKAARLVIDGWHHHEEVYPLLSTLQTALALYDSEEAERPRQYCSVPDGWQLVPKAPTEEMFGAALGLNPTDVQYVRAIWVGMLAAAPEPCLSPGPCQKCGQSSDTAGTYCTVAGCPNG